MKFSKFQKRYFELIRQDWISKGYNRAHWTNPRFDVFKIHFYAEYLKECGFSERYVDRVYDVGWMITPDSWKYEEGLDYIKYLDKMYSHRHLNRFVEVMKHFFNRIRNTFYKPIIRI